jgi:hypothetical protein
MEIHLWIKKVTLKQIEFRSNDGDKALSYDFLEVLISFNFGLISLVADIIMVFKKGKFMSDFIATIHLLF